MVAFGDGEFLLCSTFCLLGVPENLLVEVGVATGSCLVNNGRGLESASKRDIDWALPGLRVNIRVPGVDAREMPDAGLALLKVMVGMRSVRRLWAEDEGL